MIEQETTPKGTSKLNKFILIFNLEADLLRNKVRAMSKMMKMFKTLREENESVM